MGTLVVMDGPHDLGGRDGFGSIDVEPDEPTFHEAWEAKAWALNMVAIGKLRAYNADAYRHSVERMAPSWYLSAKYYERMLTGLTSLLVERGVLTQHEIEQLAGGPIDVADPVAAGAAVTHAEASARCEPGEWPRFNIGDRVTVTAEVTPGHTRCPAYIRGGTGAIVRIYKRAYFPEWRAHSPLKRLEFTYAVEFASTELWPGTDPDRDPHQAVIVEVFESYISPSAAVARIEQP